MIPSWSFVDGVSYGIDILFEVSPIIHGFKSLGGQSGSIIASCSITFSFSSPLGSYSLSTSITRSTRATCRSMTSGYGISGGPIEGPTIARYLTWFSIMIFLSMWDSLSILSLSMDIIRNITALWWLEFGIGYP